MKKAVLFYLILCLGQVSAQELLDIDRAISLALTNSDLYKKYNTELVLSQANTELFKKKLLPKVFTSSTIPSVSKSVTRVTTPDGLNIFVRQNFAYYDLSLSIEQPEPLFGGTIVLSSFLNRIDLFGDVNNKTYFSTPFSLSYINEGLSFNSYKIERIINQLRIDEENIDYNMRLEEIVFQTVQKYFDAYVVSKEIDDKKEALNEINEIYKIAKKRFEIGSINKGDLLSLELNILDTESSLNELESAQKEKQESLSKFLKSSSNSKQFTKPQEDILNLNIFYEFALNKMLLNNKPLISLERRKKEKDLEIKKYQSENKLSLGLSASYGLSNTANNFADATSNLQNQQSYLVSLKYLLFDFGRTKQDIKLMNIEKELFEDDYQVEIEDLKEDLYSLVVQYGSNQKKLGLLNKKLKISTERYNFLRNRFSLGNVTITDLNIAQKEKRQIDNEYLAVLKDVWVNYYEIRKLTMYDFESDKIIRYN